MKPPAINSVSRLTLIAALVLPTVSCSHWRAQGLGPEMIVEHDKPKEIMVTRRDGTQLVLKNPVVEADSLAGMVDEERRAVGLSDVDHLSLRRKRSLLPAVLIPLGVIVGLGALIAATWD
jgi:hypothetical protein